jgi:hypothetical protein
MAWTRVRMNTTMPSGNRTGYVPYCLPLGESTNTVCPVSQLDRHRRFSSFDRYIAIALRFMPISSPNTLQMKYLSFLLGWDCWIYTIFLLKASKPEKLSICLTFCPSVFQPCNNDISNLAFCLRRN